MTNKKIINIDFMKKLIILLCFIQSCILLAQQDTVVSPNGKKVIIDLNPVRSADNGLTVTNDNNVQLGGNLILPTIITTTKDNTLSITGLQTGTNTDNVVVTDVNGVLRIENQSLFNTEPWYVSGSSTQASANTQNIYQTGNVGIGTSTPVAKLHIKSDTPGAIKIQDGTQLEGAILTTDVNGIASWKKSASNATMIRGTVPQVGGNYSFTTGGTNTPFTAYYITLPAGNWNIYVGILINGNMGGNSNAVVRLGFSSNATVYDATSGGTVSYPANSLVVNYRSIGSTAGTRLMFCSGTMIVKTTAASTTLYLYNVGSVGGLYGGLTPGIIGLSNENYLYAVKLLGE